VCIISVVLACGIIALYLCGEDGIDDNPCLIGCSVCAPILTIAAFVAMIFAFQTWNLFVETRAVWD